MGKSAPGAPAHAFKGGGRAGPFAFENGKERAPHYPGGTAIGIEKGQLGIGDAARLELAQELDDLVASREALLERVERLRTEALDADLLDERARANLNMAFRNEMVIFHYDQAPPVTALAAHGR